MKIYLDNNLGVTNVEQEELTQDTIGYNILKVYIPNTVLTPYNTFTCYYGALLQNGRKVGWFAMEARTSSDADYEANYTLYKATLEQCVVSVEGKVYIGCQVLLGNSGNATLIKKNTAVVQFNVRKSVAINNDILVLDTDQTTTDVLESYKNLLENALTTYATKAEVYTKSQVDALLLQKADKSDTYTKSEVYTKTEANALLDTKADKSTTYTKTQVDSALVTKADRDDTDSRFLLVESAIDDLISVQNVVEVVATKSALNSYDTSKLDVNDKVQVIADETHSGASTIYNWDGTQWQYVGAFGGNSYTKQESDNKFALKSTAVTHTGNQLKDNNGNNIYPNIINDVYNSIFGFENQTYISANANRAIGNDGSVIVYGTATLYKYDVSKYKYLYINGSLYAPNTSYAHYLFLDKNNSVVSYQSPSSNTDEEKTKVFNTQVLIPSTSKYLYICVQSGTVIFGYQILLNAENTITFNSTKSLLDDILNLKIIPYIQAQSGYSIGNDGTIIAYGSATLYKYRVANYKFIRLNCTLYAPNMNYAHYLFIDNSNNVLEYSRPLANSDSEKTKTYDKYITIPNGAVYMYACISSGDILSLITNTYQIDYSIELLNKALDNIAYEDFTNKADAQVLTGTLLDTGQAWSISGTAYTSCEISNGKMVNNSGNFYMSVNRNDVKYVELSFGFVTSGTVAAILQEDTTLSKMLHLECDKTKVTLSYRVKNDSTFYKDYERLYGNPTFAELDINTTYNIKMWVDGNIVYIVKPDGTLFICAHNNFNRTYNYATYQIYNSNGNAYFTKLSAGNTNSDGAYEIAQKLKNY